LALPAWSRTGISFMGFGFLIEHFGRFGLTRTPAAILAFSFLAKRMPVATLYIGGCHDSALVRNPGLNGISWGGSSKLVCSTDTTLSRKGGDKGCQARKMRSPELGTPLREAGKAAAFLWERRLPPKG
ncbi:MAG: DUF202 domain-containing protein, partial [Thermodesulfovibrionales bacterium]